MSFERRCLRPDVPACAWKLRAPRRRRSVIASLSLLLLPMQRQWRLLTQKRGRRTSLRGRTVFSSMAMATALHSELDLGLGLDLDPAPPRGLEQVHCLRVSSWEEEGQQQQREAARRTGHSRTVCSRLQAASKGCQMLEGQGLGRGRGRPQLAASRISCADACRTSHSAVRRP
jgi:hypothetical protein